MSYASPSVTATGALTAWTTASLSYEDGASVTRLAYAFGEGAHPPELAKTDVKCASNLTSTCALVGTIVVLLNQEPALSLWRIRRRSSLECVGEIARARSRSDIVNPRIVRLRDGYVMVWYVSRGRAGGVDTGLWARTCSLALDDLDEPERIARDDDADWNEWRVFDTGSETRLVWGQGMPGARLRHLLLRERNDVRSEHRSLPGTLPDHVVKTNAGHLALSCQFSKRPYRWKLLARPWLEREA